jgi:hypothetical protein|tara:strand:+ start:291 stop:464 length:174 start_codon:yes stop_codon:yes gene_type:complete
MAAGDVTTLGPYATNSTGMTAADTALTAIQSGAASDKVMTVMGANGLEFWLIWVEGA